MDSHGAKLSKVIKQCLAHEKPCTDNTRLSCWCFDCLCFSLYSVFRLCPKAWCCSVAQLCPTLCDPMDRSTPGFPVFHHHPEFAQTHVHWVGDTIQPSRPLSPLSPPALNLSQHQSLFQWVQKAWYPHSNFQPAEQPFSRFKEDRKSQKRWSAGQVVLPRTWKRRQGSACTRDHRIWAAWVRGTWVLQIQTCSQDTWILKLFFKIFIYLATSCLSCIMWDLSLWLVGPRAHRLNCFGVCESLAPLPGIKPTSTASEDGFLTSVPPGKSQFWSLTIKQQKKNEFLLHWVSLLLIKLTTRKAVQEM